MWLERFHHFVWPCGFVVDMRNFTDHSRFSQTVTLTSHHYFPVSSIVHQHPVSSRENANLDSQPRLLRSQSLPPKRRRRRHHRSHHNPIIAPITFTPVTLQEGPHSTISPSSSPPRAMASSRKPPVRTPPVPQPFPLRPLSPSRKRPSNPHSHQQEENPDTSTSIKRKSSPTLTSTKNPKTRESSPPPGVWHLPSLPASSSRPMGKPKVSTETSEYTYEYLSSSSESSSSKSIDKSAMVTSPHQETNPMILSKDSMEDLKSLDTLELQARVLMSKACDTSISVEEFYKYLVFTNLPFFTPKELEKSKPYKMLAIFGPPGIGKSSTASSINKFIQGEQVTTTSKKFYKYVNESSNTNLYHFTNDSFHSGSEIQWGRLLQSINSIQHGIGRHFIIVEGHRLFECDDLLDMADYLVILTAKPSTLRSRQHPVKDDSLEAYNKRISPHVDQINQSDNILKINAASSLHTIVKKIGAFVALKNRGFKNSGRRLSDTPKLLEASPSTT